MRDQPPAARDYFLACYAVSLVQGETILGIPIRHSTIKHYLSAAHALFDRGATWQSEQQFAEIILKSVKDYEDVPKRRRMITDKMMQWLIDKAAQSSPNSSTRAIVDWILLGRYTGFRASEWSQKSQSNYSRLDQPGQPSQAFTRLDFGFLGDNERRLSSSEISELLIRHLVVVWRHQKNGDHGEKITFADDTISPAYSATRAGCRIYRRSLRLGMTAFEPMAVFKNDRGQVKFISDALVNALLREAASKTLNLKQGHPELQLWSTHSIRVTAANLLYRKQLSDNFIMTRLRWKSNAFLVYLRNTVHSADEHSKAASIKLSKADQQAASYRSMEPAERVAGACVLPAPAA
jgi:hypothetical protein